VSIPVPASGNEWIVAEVIRNEFATECNTQNTIDTTAVKRVKAKSKEKEEDNIIHGISNTHRRPLNPKKETPPPPTTILTVVLAITGFVISAVRIAAPTTPKSPSKTMMYSRCRKQDMTGLDVVQCIIIPNGMVLQQVFKSVYRM
ncbi:hypothetical protein PHLCEN_2v12610, partial [Hermanssonia centrifuga]